LWVFQLIGCELVCLHKKGRGNCSYNAAIDLRFR
jgi:hypothetical protein